MKRLAIVCILLATVLAQGELVHLDDFGRDDLQSQAFKLNSDQTVKIELIGPKLRNRSNVSYAWILDLNTREPVWLLDDAESERSNENRDLEDFTDEVELKEGSYQIFYSTLRNWNGNFRISDLFDWRDRNSYRRSDLRDFDLKVFASGDLINNTESYLNKLGEHSVVSITKTDANEYERIGLKVTNDTEIMIYAVGEATRDGEYDAAWIKNTKTGKRVWELNRYDSEYAGGAEKNRMFRGNVKLDEGNYVLTFVSDDSHHYDDWNAIPPYDPEAWGVSIFTEDKGDIETFSYKSEEMKNVIVSLTGLRDNEYASEGFTLSENTDIRVFAMGEGYRHDDMVDHGWIINTKTHRKVWEMDHRDTEHAGGSKKNRMIDEVINLKAGSYMVYFVTDGSHSYRDWNESRPYEGEKWGITVSGAGDFDKDVVKAYEKEEEADFLAQITRVRDDELETQRFTLDEDMDVRIYALGEGSSRDMADYGWIKNMETGRRVWEMEYRDTDHAGGARKNRVSDEVIRLKKGEYKVYYRTDGSHAFRDWNADAPHDQEHWGITVYAANN